jgi:hypothetical protein
MKSKKAQVMGLPFIYIFALIVGAMILVWGIKTVIDLKSTAGEVEAGKFLKKLEAEAKIFYNYEQGSMSEPFKVNLGSNVKYLCFADGSQTSFKCMLDGKACPTTSEFKNLVAKIKGYKTQKNVYFLPSSAMTVPQYNIKGLKPSSTVGNPACFSNGQKFNLYAAGTHVEVITV